MANGFTFDGIHCGAYGIAMLSKNRPILPGNNDSYIDVPGRNGSIHIPQGLQDRIIELECGFVETSIANLRTAARSIAAWLYTEERAALSFDDEPGKTYQAKLESAVDLEQAFVLGKFALSFRCDPLAYGAEQTDSFVSDTVTANNTGTFVAYPTFTSTFTDSATEWKVTLGTAYCRVVNNFVASDVQIDKIICGPYDDGGCACDMCQPYYKTFLDMVYDIYKIVVKYFPAIKVDICGWWTSDDELHLLKDFAKKLDGHFGEYMYSVTYGVFGVPEGVQHKISPLDLSTFVHIGFSHENKDTYIKTGIHNAQERIRSIVQSYEKAGCEGFNTYNESFGDHYNEYIISRLARNPDAYLDELTLEYIYEMFSLKGEHARSMLKIMNEMQYYDLSKAGEWEKALLEIQPFVKVNEEQGLWLFEHVLLKAQLMALDYKIGDYTKWNVKSDLDGVLPLIEEREKLFGKMFRKVYGLGLMRHCFIPDLMQAPWHKAYRKFYPVPLGNIVPGMKLSKNA